MRMQKTELRRHPKLSVCIFGGDLSCTRYNYAHKSIKINKMYPGLFLLCLLIKTLQTFALFVFE